MISLTKTLLKTLALFALACLMAGTFGAVHNQISYTVAPEYFTQFKFHQFQIAPALPHRLGAAIVGWLAAWWMGMVIGVFLIPLSWWWRGPEGYFRRTLRAFGVVVVTTLLCGLIALAVAYAVVGESIGQFERYGLQIQNDVAFARAGAMHDCSYLGGLLGIITGSCSILWARKPPPPTRGELSE